mmetsp:Transcript_49643/g.142367  ORF Transcript_49643/g.142367 Transcript_49643/m.142367 type:complete len:310 (+) Transcript_49643:249-1178(+)
MQSDLHHNLGSELVLLQLVSVRVQFLQDRARDPREPEERPDHLNAEAVACQRGDRARLTNDSDRKGVGVLGCTVKKRLRDNLGGEAVPRRSGHLAPQRNADLAALARRAVLEDGQGDLVAMLVVADRRRIAGQHLLDQLLGAWVVRREEQQLAEHRAAELVEDEFAAPALQLFGDERGVLDAEMVQKMLEQMMRVGAVSCQPDAAPQRSSHLTHLLSTGGFQNLLHQSAPISIEGQCGHRIQDRPNGRCISRFLRPSGSVSVGGLGKCLGGAAGPVVHGLGPLLRARPGRIQRLGNHFADEGVFDNERH